MALSLIGGISAGNLEHPYTEATENGNATLKIMSYNIRNGLGMDNTTDYARIGRLIREAEPEVAAIQEVDSVTERSRGVFVLEEIARHAGMVANYAPAIDYGGGKYGIGILSREEPLAVRRIALPGREEPRALLIAEFDKYVFACTHLSLTDSDRVASAEIIIRDSQTYDKPFFIAGDFNDYPDSEAIMRLSEHFVALSNPQPTWPSDNPSEIIDYIMVSRPHVARLTTTDTKVLPEALASDHRPITVTVELR